MRKKTVGEGLMSVLWKEEGESGSWLENERKVDVGRSE